MINKLLNKFKSNKIEYYNEEYESRLYKQYGNCNKFSKSIKILAIADTHGSLKDDEFKLFLKDIQTFDLVILLGDHANLDIEIILKNVDKNKIVGILGNHDYDYLSKYNILNINGKIIEVNGIKFLGIEGSFKYKEENYPSFTQEESLEFLNCFPSVDILVSHDQKYNYLSNYAHQGLIGITNYLYKNKISYHIHGHIHKSYQNEMLNGTKEICVFKYEIIEIN